MTQPNWTPLALLKVEAKPEHDAVWNQAVDFVPPSRLLRLRIVDQDSAKKSVSTKWSLNEGLECGPNGIPASSAKTALLCSSASQGSLIGKLGGSSADLPDSAQPTAPWGTSKKVFPVGAYCIFALSSSDSGPLFLTMNDGYDSFKSHAGALYVQIDVASL